MKTCRQCRTAKTPEAFWKRSASPDGLQETCKLCFTQYKAERPKADVLKVQRAWCVANRDKVNKYSSEYKARNSAKVRAESQAWLEDHKDLLAARLRALRAADPEKYLNNQREYRRLHPEKHRAYNHNRRAMHAQVLATLTQLQWEQILELFGQTCAYCGSDKSITMDHIVPISRGGNHTEDNVIPACKSCNASKGAKVPHEWGMKQPKVRDLDPNN